MEIKAFSICHLSFDIFHLVICGRIVLSISVISRAAERSKNKTKPERQ